MHAYFACACKFFMCMHSSVNDCAICYEPLEDSDDVQRTPCAHTFHLSCIGRWVLQRQQDEDSPTCPLCRTSLQGWLFPVAMPPTAVPTLSTPQRELGRYVTMTVAVDRLQEAIDGLEIHQPRHQRSSMRGQRHRIGHHRNVPVGTTDSGAATIATTVVREAADAAIAARVAAITAARAAVRNAEALLSDSTAYGENAPPQSHHQGQHQSRTRNPNVLVPITDSNLTAPQHSVYTNQLHRYFAASRR